MTEPRAMKIPVRSSADSRQHSSVERVHPRAAECPICGHRNDMPSECLSDEWAPQLCDHCKAPIIVCGKASGVHPREEYEVVCRTDVDALIALMTKRQLDAVEALPTQRHNAVAPGEIGFGASLRELRDLKRGARGIFPPIILAHADRRDSDGKREWWLSDLGVAVRARVRMPSFKIRAHQVVGFRSGECRNDPKATSHTYAMMADDGLWPMCGYGWNRSGGSRFSIFRGSPGTEGNCKLCRANVAAGRPPVMHGYPHRTRWL